MDNYRELTGRSEAAERADRANKCEVRTRSVWRILSDNIFTVFNLINVILAAALALVGSFRNMLFMGVAVCNTAIGVFQEIRSKRALDKLSLITAPKAHVIRGGTEKEIEVSAVIADDIMLLKSGRQVCADCVVIDGECEADESLISGESEPVPKKPGDELASGSFITSGSCAARVIRIGAESVSGKITSAARKHKKHGSVMMKAINRIIKTVSACIFPFGIILFVKSRTMGNSLEECVSGTAAALIGMIPEGLMLLTSIALAVSSIRLTRKNTLCQDLYCAESLSRADVLCLDKTGTITEGRMKVAEIVPVTEDLDVRSALSAFAAAFSDKNSTLSAIAEYCGEYNGAKPAGTVPFSSARKWSAAELEGFGTLILGAPNAVLGESGKDFDELCGKYYENGMRVLVLAKSENPCRGYELPENIQAAAFVVLSDNIRESAPEALKFFREQGVEIKVISGDDPKTASYAAKRAGLAGAENYIDMSEVSDGDIDRIAEKYTVFGRVTPARKLALVMALKAAGHTVAMTGDGVNDVPALREADCSVTVRTGSDAARCVSQLVLMDSDFSSLPAAVLEGRRCINNIERSAALFLVKTVFSFLLSAAFLFLPFSYPFKPIQLTLISAVMIGIPSFLLTLEPNFGIVRGKFAANVLKRAAPGGIAAAAGVCAVTAVGAFCGYAAEHASVMAVFLTAAVCFSVLLKVCAPFNKKRAAMCAGLAGIFAALALLFPQAFYIVPLSAGEWAALGLITTGTLFVQSAAGLAAKRFFK